jgi:hypothetical protein
MKLLTQGGLTVEMLDAYFELSNIQSTDIKDALKFYLVDGWSESSASAFNRVSLSNFRRALAKLERLAQYVELIVQLRIKAHRQSTM